MGRIPRSFVKGEIYHVIQRGNNREHIFQHDADKRALINITRNVKQKISFELLYYVLMDNHYHFVIRMTKDTVSDVMQRINWSYSTFFNKKYDRCGTIFGQRFKAYHVKNNRYLRALIKYIAMNPVRSNLTRKPEQYQWSAHRDFVLNCKSIAHKEALLNLFDKNKNRAMDAYKYLVDQTPQEMHRDDMRDLMFKDRIKSLKSHFTTMISYANVSYFSNNKAKDKKGYELIAEFVRHAFQVGFTTNELAQALNTSKNKIYFLKNVELTF